MNRNEFLKLSSGLLGSIAIPGLMTSSGKAAPANNQGLDKSYLEKGLTGMAKSDGWFDAHWGAGILAGYYLCKENQLDEETVNGIRTQLDVAIAIRSDQFSLLPKEAPDQKAIANISKTLEPAIEGGLRAHGHAVIFSSLSTKALQDAPHMAQPSLIEKICGHNRLISKKKPKTIGSADSYQNTQEMIDATFDSIIRFESLLGYPSIKRPNFTHMITHTEALLNWEEMGLPDIAKAGHLGHRTHISEEVPEIPSSAVASRKSASLELIMNKEYWNDTRNQEQWNKSWDFSNNPNGYWIAAGHLFKVLYSYHRLIKRVEDKSKVELCSKILLERYMNPEIMGG